MTRVGILGAGQLGRMMALAGYPLGLRFRFLDSAAEQPASQLAESVAAPFHDEQALGRFLDGLSVVTYEFENVPLDLARQLTQSVPVYPPPQALAASQDRLPEKTLFRQFGLPTAPFAPIDSKEDLQSALHTIGYPAVLKTRRGGYDGKGQAVLRSAHDVERFWPKFAGVPSILEGFVEFERELSQIAVRGRDGATLFYPLVENHHRDGILRLSIAPAPSLTAELTALAQDHVARLLNALEYVGVLTVEFFQAGGALIANEMAPRVHNSGHWTIEGSRTSQFENHLRAILGWPLGATEMVAPCAMLNLIGTAPETSTILAIPDAHLHLYGKAPRPGRKLGHITLCASEHETLRRRLETIQASLPGVFLL